MTLYYYGPYWTISGKPEDIAALVMSGRLMNYLWAEAMKPVSAG